MVVHWQMCVGKEFQSRGAVALKLMSPTDRDVLGTQKQKFIISRSEVWSSWNVVDEKITQRWQKSMMNFKRLLYFRCSFCKRYLTKNLQTKLSCLPSRYAYIAKIFYLCKNELVFSRINDSECLMSKLRRKKNQILFFSF